LSYELSKHYLAPYHVVANKTINDGLIHMVGATLGEIAACSVRVPSEVIKQRVQISQFATSWQALRYILRKEHGEGIWLGLYRGWGTTIMREIPFTIIQFPLYEYLKKLWADRTDREKVTPKEGAVCGSIAGGVAAGLTNPLDVLKTRLMLNKTRVSAGTLLATIIREEGYPALIKGIGPRVMWISAGGAVFLGVYEVAREGFGLMLNDDVY
jgi:solute carrier family 25 (mitochondrial S-adenosylmethionine transporter), member 26